MGSTVTSLELHCAYPIDVIELCKLHVMNGSKMSEAKKKLEDALTEYIVAEYGPDHWLGDYVMSVVVLDMTPGAYPEATNILHTGKGPYHAQRGLTEEQSDWLIDLKMEERDE